MGWVKAARAFGGAMTPLGSQKVDELLRKLAKCAEIWSPWRSIKSRFVTLLEVGGWKTHDWATDEAKVTPRKKSLRLRRSAV
ncbi:MAG TPA: hypothetical protein PLZ57_07460 [Pseudobdellovibrionaceae bacterium]|nr:hypothetical protein [Pseudobdellovibrionaceae bacterium]